MRLPLATFRRDQRGASALEFALVAPLFFLLLIGLIQVSLWMFANHVLNEALWIGSRTLYFDMSDTQSAITATKQAASQRFLNRDLLQLTVKRYETPYPRLELNAVYPFTGIGFGLPNGRLDISASVSVAISE